MIIVHWNDGIIMVIATMKCTGGCQHVISAHGEGWNIVLVITLQLMPNKPKWVSVHVIFSMIITVQ